MSIADVQRNCERKQGTHDPPSHLNKEPSALSSFSRLKCFQALSFTVSPRATVSSKSTNICRDLCLKAKKLIIKCPMQPLFGGGSTCIFEIAEKLKTCKCKKCPEFVIMDQVLCF